MSGLNIAVVVLCFASTSVMCGPMPQQPQPKNDEQQKQDDQHQKHAVEHYTNSLVANPRIRENYLSCFLDNGPCSPEANSIKQLLPEAIQKECAHCTELQKKVIEKMMCYLNNHQPEILKQVAAKFDPNGEYIQQYLKTLEQKRNEPEYLISTVQRQNPQQPQQNPQQPQQNPQQPQPNPQQPQQNPQQPQQNPQQPQQNPQQPQQNPQQPQHNPQQPQQNSQQPQQNQHQPQQNQQQEPTVITSSPIATVVTPKP